MQDNHEKGPIDDFIAEMVEDLRGLGYHIGILKSTMPCNNQNMLIISDAVVVKLPKEESSGVEAKASEAGAGDGEG